MLLFLMENFQTAGVSCRIPELFSGWTLAPTPSVKRTKQAAAQIQQSVTSHFFWSFRVIYQCCYTVALRLCKMPLEIFSFYYFLPPFWEVGKVVSIIVTAVHVRKLRLRQIERVV